MCNVTDEQDTSKGGEDAGSPLGEIKQGVQRMRGELDTLRAKVEAVHEEVQTLRDAPPSDSQLLTREEAAKVLRISVRKLDTLEAAGEIRAIRIGRLVRYHPETVDAFIRRRSREGSKR